MAVKIYKDRKALVLEWERGEYEGPVLLKTSSEEDPEGSSTRVESNPGYAAVTFPLEHTGKFDVVVLDSENNVIDEGTVKVD